MKAKKIVSLLLAVMLLVGMLPLSAFATAPAEMSQITVTLKSTGTFGSLRDTLSVWNDDLGDYEDVTVDTLEKYSQYVVSGNMGSGPTAINVNPTQKTFAASKLENFTPVLSSKSQKSTVGKDERVYITVKVECADEIIAPYTVHIQYDGNYFEPDPDYKTKTIPNGLMKDGGACNKNVPTAVTDETSEYKGKTFGGALQVAGSSNAYEDATTGKNTFVLQYAYKDDAYHVGATGTDWDYVIPFIAKAPVTDSEFKVITYGNNAGTAGGSIYIREDGDTGAFGNGANVYECSQDDPKVTGNSTYVTVTSSDPAASVPATTVIAGTSKDVTVSLKNATFIDGLGDTGITLSGGTGTAPTVKFKSLAADKASAVYTVSAAAGCTAGQEWTVTVAGNNYKNKAGAEVAADLTATGKITVGAPLDGTVNVTGTATYGQKLTAGITGMTTDPGDVTFTWYKNSVADGNKITTGVSSSSGTKNDELTLGKGQGLTYGGSDTIIAVASSANLDNTTVSSSATSAVAKKTLNAPSTITGIQSVKTNSSGNDKKVTGTYTFTKTDGVLDDDLASAPSVTYTATYGDTSSKGTKNDVSVELPALSGNDYYIFAGTTLSNQTGEVKDQAVYQLTTDSKGTDNTTTLSLGTTTYNGGTAVNIDVTGLKGYEKIGTPTTTVSGVTLTRVDDDTFSIQAATLPESATSDTTVAITIPVEIKTLELTASNLTVSHSKPYDGTGTVTASDVTIEITGLTGDYASKDNVTLTATGAEYVDANGKFAPGIKTLKITGLTKSDENDGKYYTLASALTAADGFEVTMTGTDDGIIAAEIADKTVTATATTEDALGNNPTIDEVLAAVKNAPITVDGIEPTQGKVSDYFTNDEDLKTEIAKVTGVVHTAGSAGTPAVEPTLGTEVTGAITIGTGTVTGSTWVLPEGATLTAPTGFTYDAATHTLTLTGDSATEITGSTITVTKQDSTTFDITVDTFTPTAPAPAVPATDESWDFSALAGQNLVVPLKLTAQPASGDLATNFDWASVTAAAPVTVAVTAPVASNNPPVPAGFTASFNTNGYATVSATDVEIVDGKVKEWPTVSDVVLGATFKGWSVDGGKTTIDPETYEFTEDTELTAVFEGYMAGFPANDKGEVEMKPKDKLTRGQLAKILAIASGKYDSQTKYGTDGAPSFADAKDHWAANFIACLEDNNMIDGYPDGTFKPQKEVTRYEAAKMIASAFGVETNKADTTDKITDIDQVPDWVKEYVVAMCNNGTIDGFNGVFKGQLDIQRDATAKMVNRYIGMDDTAKAEILADESIKSPYVDVLDSEKNTGAGWAYADLMFASLRVPGKYYVTEIKMPTAE